MRPGSEGHLTRRRKGKWDTTGVLLADAAADQPADMAAIFGNTRPVEVEIGTGKGTFLLARAASRPELNFLGIEWARAYCHYAADRARRAGLTNLRMLRADAAAFFARAMPASSLLRVHIYFPDPWPKRRHHHRRLIQTAFAADVRRTLRIGGQVVIVTDHMGYFRHIQAVMLAVRGLASAPFPKMTGGENELVGTNFERKYIAQGRAFYPATYLRYA